MLVFSNIGPHPGHLKTCSTPDAYLSLARQELLQLVTALAPHSDGFVINLSSPNTLGLRGLLSDPRLACELVLPIQEQLKQIPLLIKLPPDDPDKQPWTETTLRPVIEPLLEKNVCDGFVAVNTSTHLSQSLLQRELGGISGSPLLPLAIDCVILLRKIVGPEKLIIGCGGITKPLDAVVLHGWSAQLVELYTGMIFAGPRLPAECAAALGKVSS